MSQFKVLYFGVNSSISSSKFLRIKKSLNFFLQDGNQMKGKDLWTTMWSLSCGYKGGDTVLVNSLKTRKLVSQGHLPLSPVTHVLIDSN